MTRSLYVQVTPGQLTPPLDSHPLHRSQEDETCPESLQPTRDALLRVYACWVNAATHALPVDAGLLAPMVVAATALVAGPLNGDDAEPTRLIGADGLTRDRPECCSREIIMFASGSDCEISRLVEIARGSDKTHHSRPASSAAAAAAAPHRTAARVNCALLAALGVSAALRPATPRSAAALAAAERRVGAAAASAALSPGKLDRLLGLPELLAAQTQPGAGGDAKAGAAASSSAAKPPPSEAELVKIGAQLAQEVAPEALAVIVGTFAEEDGDDNGDESDEAGGRRRRGGGRGREVALVELRGADPALLAKLKARDE